MKPFIAPEDATRVEAAIQSAETRTRAELVAVVAERSDDYRYIILALAAVLGLAAPFPWSLGFIAAPHGVAPEIMAHGMALLVFASVLGLGQIDAVKRFITPKSLMRRRAHRNARAQFFAQRVRMTRDRAGVLLFVSAFERHVEIIADDAAAEAVSPEEWQRAVDAFIASLHASGPCDGFLSAIAVLDKALATALPGDADDRNELHNRLIILDA